MRRLLAIALESLFAGVTDNVFRSVLRLPTPARLPGTLVRRLRERALERSLRASAGADPGDDSPLSAALLRLFDLVPGPFFEGFLQGYRAYRSDSLVDFRHGRQTHFDFTFWAFSEAAWPGLVEEYIRFCRDHARNNDGYRPALFTEIYFMPRDRRARVAPSIDGPVFTLDMVDNRPPDPRWKAINRAYNEWAVAHGGRPLLNQTKELEATPDVVRRAYGAAWKEFSAAVWKANPPLPGAPNGRFVSGFFAPLLDPR